MKKLYNFYKESLVKTPNYNGVVCGYNDVHLILAVTNSPMCSFTKLDKFSVVNKKYKTKKFKYVYADEAELLNSF